jgi:precorrin-6B C5,15-methyltransferase / cobalt-precorrin-6B C5,C15-methyltransferase
MHRENPNPVHVVGTGLDPAGLPLALEGIVREAQVLVGGERLLRALKDHPARKIPIRSPVSEAMEAVDRENRAGKRVVVLADGDPGLFGIGEKLALGLGPERVLIHPNISILQAAAARIRSRWDDIRTVSLHGRKDLWPLRRAVARRRRVGVYTDAAFPPGRIAEEMSSFDAVKYRMHVFEDLGAGTESISAFEDYEDAAGREFSPLSFILLEPAGSPGVRLTASLDDDLIVHEDGLLTKREIRAAGLGLLGIEPGHVVWDLGSGSGAVALESSFLASEGMVFAVEKDRERLEMIRRNIRRTGACGVQPVQGVMPACLRNLPDPDRVFVGGGAGRQGVMEAVMDRLRAGGRLVIHAVLLGTLRHAVMVLQEAGWGPAVTQIQAARSRPLAGDIRLEALNPVFAVNALKPEQAPGVGKGNIEP